MALTDLFYFNTYAWEDDVEDLPIKYSFGYVSGSANESDTSSEVILRTAMESSVAHDVVLPQVGADTSIWMAQDSIQCTAQHFFSIYWRQKHPCGRSTPRAKTSNDFLHMQGYGSSSLLFTSVYAVDSLGASSRSTFGVIVTEFDGGVEGLGSVVENVASEAVESGDIETAMQVRVRIRVRVCLSERFAGSRCPNESLVLDAGIGIGQMLLDNVLHVPGVFFPLLATMHFSCPV